MAFPTISRPVLTRLPQLSCPGRSCPGIQFERSAGVKPADGRPMAHMVGTPEFGATLFADSSALLDAELASRSRFETAAP